MAGFVRVLDSKVRYVGDAVALVAAETEDIAAEALRLIKVEYEPLPAVYEVEEALQPGAAQLYEKFPGNVLPRGCLPFGREALQEVVIGNVDLGIAEADIIIEGTYAYENIPNPLPPESPAVIAVWEGPDTLKVWPVSQTPHMQNIALSEKFETGIPWIKESAMIGPAWVVGVLNLISPCPTS